MFKEAFADSTGMPLSFVPIGIEPCPCLRHGNRNDLCATLARNSLARAYYRELGQSLRDEQPSACRTVTCPAGLSHSVVPVRVDGNLIGFLQTGQVRQERCATQQPGLPPVLPMAWGLNRDCPALQCAYAAVPVLSPERYAAAVALLGIFAEQLSLIGSRLSAIRQLEKHPILQKAEEFIIARIARYQDEELSLGQTAGHCHVSTFYLCKLFARETRLNFSTYVARLRIEKAKQLLSESSLPICQIGYGVGFRTLTHFNRTFKNLAGRVPVSIEPTRVLALAIFLRHAA